MSPARGEPDLRTGAQAQHPTRYLHDGILDYVERLTATFASDITTAIMTCTGSEANDIALRMAEAVTGKRGVIVTDYTYHYCSAAECDEPLRHGGRCGYGSRADLCG